MKVKQKLRIFFLRHVAGLTQHFSSRMARTSDSSGGEFRKNQRAADELSWTMSASDLISD